MNKISTNMIGIFALVLPVCVWAQSEPTLLNFEWQAELCLENDRKQACQTMGHMKDGDLFSIVLDTNNRLALAVEEAGNGQRHSFPLKVSRLCQSDCDVNIVEAEFDDQGTDKSLTMAVLRGGASGPTSEDCENWIKNEAPANQFSSEQIAAECAREHLVYWYIDTLEEKSGEGASAMMAPPGDGHGTGSDGGQ